jgi:hypothetical protein
VNKVVCLYPLIAYLSVVSDEEVICVCVPHGTVLCVCRGTQASSVCVTQSVHARLCKGRRSPTPTRCPAPLPPSLPPSPQALVRTRLTSRVRCCSRDWHACHACTRWVCALACVCVGGVDDAMYGRARADLRCRAHSNQPTRATASHSRASQIRDPATKAAVEALIDAEDEARKAHRCVRVCGGGAARWAMRQPHCGQQVPSQHASNSHVRAAAGASGSTVTLETATTRRRLPSLLPRGARRSEQQQHGCPRLAARGC